MTKVEKKIEAFLKKNGYDYEPFQYVYGSGFCVDCCNYQDGRFKEIDWKRYDELLKRVKRLKGVRVERRGYYKLVLSDEKLALESRLNNCDRLSEIECIGFDDRTKEMQACVVTYLLERVNEAENAVFKLAEYATGGEIAAYCKVHDRILDRYRGCLDKYKA